MLERYGGPYAGQAIERCFYLLGAMRAGHAVYAQSQCVHGVGSHEVEMQAGGVSGQGSMSFTVAELSGKGLVVLQIWERHKSFPGCLAVA